MAPVQGRQVGSCLLDAGQEDHVSDPVTAGAVRGLEAGVVGNGEIGCGCQREGRKRRNIRANSPAFAVVAVALVPEPSVIAVALPIAVPVAVERAVASGRERWAVIGAHPSAGIPVAAKVVVPVALTIALAIPVAVVAVKVTFPSRRRRRARAADAIGTGRAERASSGWA